MNTYHGWTTWDPSSMAVWEHLPSGLRCHLVVQDEEGREMLPTRWQPVEEYLTGVAGDALAHVMLTVGATQVEIECGGHGDLAACRVKNIFGDHLTAHWEVEGARDGWQIRQADREVTLAPLNIPLPEDVGLFLDSELDALHHTIPQGKGLLETPLIALEAALAANTITLPETGEIITLSRHHTEEFGLWRIPNWETFLTAVGIAYVDPLLAVENCRTALRHLNAGNMLAGAATVDGVLEDLSHPPVAAFCIWKIVQMSGDFSLLNDAYPILLRWHDWWGNFRDGNYNHLLEWASPEETGMVGHPVYENVPIDPRTGDMRMDDVALGSLWALDAYALMRMALQMNDLDRATHLEQEMNSVASRMRVSLWDPDDGLFRSRYWDTRWNRRLTATTFLTLAGGIPTADQAQLLVNHLDFEFATEFLLPTLGKADSAFADQLPWRGRISPLLNYLICEGMRHYMMDDWAERITLDSLRMISESWERDHSVFGSYHAQNGLGGDIAQDSLDPTGLLLSALGVMMLIDIDPWDGIRLGNLSGSDMAVEGLMLRGDRYDLSSGQWGFSVVRNCEPWFESDTPVVIRNLTQHAGEISFNLAGPAERPIHLKFYGFAPDETVQVKINGQARTALANSQGVVEDTITLPA